MSSSEDHTTRAIARQTHLILKAAGARFTGKERGPDPRVLRNSYDVEDARAKPWARIGNGTIGEGLAHREALLQTAREHRLQHWRENPPEKVRQARERRDAIAAELKQMENAGAVPIGRPAVLRAEMSKLEQLLDAARSAIRRIDITVLSTLIERVDFATGRLFPTIDTIASDAGCHRNTVLGALVRLKAHGFVAWVRRSMATGNDHQFAPQREQTSNAYYFEHRQAMATPTWTRFVQILTYKLRRLGKAPAAQRDQAERHGPPTREVSEFRHVLASLGAAVANAST